MWTGSFYIDRLTNSIEDARSGINHPTSIIPISHSDLKLVSKKKGWIFNWKEEYEKGERQLYKLLIEGDTIIQGLLSLEIKIGYIEMHLIETAPHNYGRSKKYIGVPGNLVAFACKLSFLEGYEGNIGFIAKTKLIQHYKDTLGAELFSANRMGIYGNSAKKLVNSYYKNFFDEK